MAEPHADDPVLVEFERGGADRVETRHRGAIAVVDSDGRLLWHTGDVNEAYALRSTAKPFQLLPLLLDGLHAQAHALTDADLAVMMSSHNGEPMHTERIAALLAHFGLTPDALQCGAEPPALRADRERLVLERRHATPLPRSIDGCSLPTFWLPLEALARLFAFIADPGAAPEVEGQSIEAELTRLRAAGMRHPELVAGSRRLDTLLMQALEGRLFAKTGAAGLYTVALPEGPRVPAALGIAIKVEDGDPRSRIRASVIAEVLRQLGIVSRDDADLWALLADIENPVEKNF